MIGRAVNGWIDEWRLDEPTDLDALIADVRRTGEGTVNGDQLGWILDRWKKRDGGYDTSTSQFWSTIRLVAAGLDQAAEPDWPSTIAWSNLCKVAPAGGGNPGSRLLALQRRDGPALLAREVSELSPRRVVAFTGGWWFEPFANALGLEVEWREGLVEGVAHTPGRTWVVAVHPMTRSPSAVASAVLAALVEEPTTGG